MIKFASTCLLILTCLITSAQSGLPYRQLPPTPDQYTAGNVAARMIDGLGFRFYWATEGLTKKDLAFKPSSEARTSEETIRHIYSMSFIILNASLKKENISGQDKPASFDEMRSVTLQNLKSASEQLAKETDKELSGNLAVFSDENEKVKFPFWLMINGPIADCLWHVGQVVSFRRSSGNPFSEKVDVFTGTIQP